MRILLVDDYANTSLMKDESSNSEGLDPHGKLKIIINDINKIGAYNIAWCSPSPNDFSIIRQNTSLLRISVYSGNTRIQTIIVKPISILFMFRQKKRHG